MALIAVAMAVIGVAMIVWWALDTKKPGPQQPEIGQYGPGLSPGTVRGQ